MDAEVVTSYTETIEIGYVECRDVKDCSDKKDTPIVFIDGSDYVQDIE